MTLSKLMRGLEILAPHYMDRDGYHVDAAHDEIYLHATDRELPMADVVALYELGWFQPRSEMPREDRNKDWTPLLYHPSAAWMAFV